MPSESRLLRFGGHLWRIAMLTRGELSSNPTKRAGVAMLQPRFTRKNDVFVYETPAK